MPEQRLVPVLRDMVRDPLGLDLQSPEQDLPHALVAKAEVGQDLSDADTSPLVWRGRKGLEPGLQRRPAKPPRQSGGKHQSTCVCAQPSAPQVKSEAILLCGVGGTSGFELI